MSDVRMNAKDNFSVLKKISLLQGRWEDSKSQHLQLGNLALCVYYRPHSAARWNPVDVKNVQAVPTVCKHGSLKAHRGSRVFIFEKNLPAGKFSG